VLTGTPVPPPEVLLASEARRSKFADLLTMLFQRWRTRSGALEREARRLGLAILDAIAEETRGIGATPVFAYLPVYGEITKPDMAMTARERFFFSYCRERGIQSTYLRPFFLKKMKQGTEFKAYGHWGPQEHRTAAEGIAAYLVEKGVIQAPHP
jgi:hypothetical protein